VNLVGKPGQTVDAGSFTYTAQGDQAELIPCITVTVTDPALLSSMTVNATFDESSATSTVTPPVGTTVFYFNPPISVAPGSSVNFSMTAVIAGGAAATKAGILQTWFKGNTSSGGFFGGGFANSRALLTMTAHLREVFPLSSSGSILPMLLGAILPILLITYIFQGGIRQRMIAASFGMFIATMTMSGCDPCPSCKERTLKSTVQTLVAVEATDSLGNQLSVTGLPVILSQLSK
jgi:hypothetical protein